MSSSSPAAKLLSSSWAIYLSPHEVFLTFLIFNSGNCVVLIKRKKDCILDIITESLKHVNRTNEMSHLSENWKEKKKRLSGWECSAESDGSFINVSSSWSPQCTHSPCPHLLSIIVICRYWHAVYCMECCWRVGEVVFMMPINGSTVSHNAEVTLLVTACEYVCVCSAVFGCDPLFRARSWVSWCKCILMIAVITPHVRVLFQGVHTVKTLSPTSPRRQSSSKRIARFVLLFHTFGLKCCSGGAKMPLTGAGAYSKHYGSVMARS